MLRPGDTRGAFVIALALIGCGGSTSTGTADGGNHTTDGGPAEAGPGVDTGTPIVDASTELSVVLDTGSPEATADAACVDDGGVTQPAPVQLSVGAMCPGGNEAIATWSLTGGAPAKYQTGFDHSMSCNANPALHLASTVATGSDFGAMAGVKGPSLYAGHRVRLSAWVITSMVTGWAGLWMRVDTPQMNAVAFDNMQCRAITGTTGWEQVQVVLDVAPDASEIVYGVLLADQGEVWVDGATFDIVDACVPLTGCP